LERNITNQDNIETHVEVKEIVWIVSEYHHGQGCSFHALKEEQRLFFKPSFPISLKISMSTQHAVRTLNNYFLFSCHWYDPFLKHARVYFRASSRANISLDSFLYLTNCLPLFCVISNGSCNSRCSTWLEFLP